MILDSENVNEVYGITPLISAIKQENIQLVQYLIDLDADITQPCTAGKTQYLSPLNACMFIKDKTIRFAIFKILVEKLIEKYGEITAKEKLDDPMIYIFEGAKPLTGHTYSLLFKAVSNNDIDLSKFIVEKGAMLDQIGLNSHTPLKN